MTTAAFADATIVFDLDGTFIDTAPDLVEAVNVALAAEGHPPVPIEALRHMVGRGARAMIAEALEATGRAVSETRLDELREIFLVHYEAHIADLSRPFPGLLPALDRLEVAGAAFAVCTNKREHMSRRLLEALGLMNRFAALIGYDTLKTRKPDPEPVREAVARSGRPLARAVMVGDSSFDVRAAHGAGIPCVVVRFGYSDMDPDAMGADAVIGHYDELVGTVERLLG